MFNMYRCLRKHKNYRFEQQAGKLKQHLQQKYENTPSKVPLIVNIISDIM